jgi:hypothetical protein
MTIASYGFNSRLADRWKQPETGYDELKDNFFYLEFLKGDQRSLLLKTEVPLSLFSCILSCTISFDEKIRRNAAQAAQPGKPFSNPFGTLKPSFKHKTYGSVV